MDTFYKVIFEGSQPDFLLPAGFMKMDLNESDLPTDM